MDKLVAQKIIVDRKRKNAGQAQRAQAAWQCRAPCSSQTELNQMSIYVQHPATDFKVLIKGRKDDIFAEIVQKFRKITRIPANYKLSILIEGKSVRNEKASLASLGLKSGSTLQLGSALLLGGSSDNKVMNLEVNDSQSKLIGQDNDS